MGKRKSASTKHKEKMEKRRRRIISSGSDSEELDDERATDPSRTDSVSTDRAAGLPPPSPLPGPSRILSTDPTPVSSHNPAPDTYPSLLVAADKDDEMLDDEILALLGDAPKPDTKFGKAIHKDLASRWQDILEKGLPKETKEKIHTEYLTPENCPLLVAPTLNPEVKAALAEPMVKRDTAMMMKQKQLGIAVAALGQAVQLILDKADHTKILKPISDACRLICDSHNAETNTRRGFAVSSIKADLRETLKNSKRDALLFGENLSENLKSAKTVQKSSIDLKPQKSQMFNKSNFIKNNKNEKRLNWRTLPRKLPFRQDEEKPRPAQRPPGTRNSFQQRGLAERPPPARPNRRH